MTGDIEDITRWREDMNFVVLATSNIKFISSSQGVMFFLFFKRTDDDVLDDFPKISDHFPKISEDCRILSRKTRRCFDDTPTNLSTI